MNEIVIMSGKGGTGKTSITAALAALAGEKAVVADCDVDAANMHLLLAPERMETHDFVSGKTAYIHTETCTACGLCTEKCRFDAISFAQGTYMVNPVDCEGCSLCHYICPAKAIEMKDNTAGQWFISRSRFGSRFVHAKLGIAQENSGKLVGKVKTIAQSSARELDVPYILVDGAPGIGCPVISSLSGADHILIVTEASESGLHDLERLVELIQYFSIQGSCIINKCDLNDAVKTKIETFCNANNVSIVNSIPYSSVFTETLQQGKTIVESNDRSIISKIEEIWNYVQSME